MEPQEVVEFLDRDGGNGDLQAHLAAEEEKQCVFSKNPVCVKIDVHLIEVSGVPSNVSLGPIPNDVFINGFKLPGLLVGVKESRVLGKILLCFANSSDCDKSWKYIGENGPKPILKTFSGVPVSLSISPTGSNGIQNPQSVICFPAPEEIVGRSLHESWNYQKTPTNITVHAWRLTIDVKSREIANDEKALERHFRPFSKSAAILRITKATDSSMLVTLDVADERSVGYLQRQAEKLRDHSYLEVFEVRESRIDLPILHAVRGGRFNPDMTLQGGSSLVEASIMPREPISGKVYSSLMLKVFNQEPWHLSLYMNEIFFSSPGFTHQYVTRRGRHGDLSIVLPFRRKIVAHFVVKIFESHLHEILQRHKCDLTLGLPRLGPRPDAGTKFIVLTSKDQSLLVSAAKAIDVRGREIERGLKCRRLLLDAVSVDILVQNADAVIQNSQCYLHLPPLGSTVSDQLANVNINFTLRGRLHSVQIEVVKYASIRKADVDMLAIFPGPDLVPFQRISGLATDHGHASIVDECSWLYFQNGKLAYNRYNRLAVISSGCLRCRALLCANTYHPPHTSLDSCLLSLFDAAKASAAKSLGIAEPFKPGAVCSRDWLRAVFDQVIKSLGAGYVPRKVVISSGQSSKELQEDLHSVLQVFERKHTGMGISYIICDNGPMTPRCRLSTNGILYALADSYLDNGEARIRSHLCEKIHEKPIVCPGIDAALAVKCWKNKNMDAKTLCRLSYNASHPTTLILSGTMEHIEETNGMLPDILSELTSGLANEGSMSGNSLDQDNAGAIGTDRGALRETSDLSTISPADTTGGNPNSATTLVEVADEPSHDEVEDAVAQGHANVRRARGFLCGEYGTGKSSLLRALLGDEFITQADSTPGVRVERTMVFVPPDNTHLPHQVFRRFEGVSKLYAELTAAFVHQRSQEATEPDAGVSKHSEPSAIAISLQLPSQASVAVHQKVAAESERPPGNFELSFPDHDNTLDEDESEDDQSCHWNDDINDMFNTSLPSLTNNDIVVGMEKLTLDERKHFLRKVTEELQIIRNLPPDTVMDRTYFELWDFGGQMAMTTQHSICVDTERSFFFLIFNAGKDLDEKVTKEEFCQDGEKVELPLLFEGMTHRDFLMMWLSIISLRQQSTSSEVTAKTKVFFVATHIDLVPDDQVERRKEKVRNDVKTLLRPVKSSRLELSGPYFVDNRRLQDSVTKHSEMEALQKDVHKAVLTIPQEQTSLIQMKLEDALSLWQSSSTDTQANQKESEVNRDTAPSVTHVQMPYRKFQDLAKYVSSDNMTVVDMRKSLKFFHQLGSIMCHDHDALQDDSLIFLNPEWILQKIAHLVISPLLKPLLPNELDLEDDLEQLQEHGVLSERLLGGLWKDLDGSTRQSLMAIMCRFDLASLVTSSPSESSAGREGDDCGKCYLIPICMAAKPSDQLALSDEAFVSPPLLLKLADLHFPPPIFHRLVNHCISSFEVQKGHMQRDFSAIILDVDSLSHIQISWSYLGLQLGFCSSHKKPKAYKLSSRLLQVLEKGLKDLRSQQGYRSLKWKIAFQCQTAKCNPVPAVEGVEVSQQHSTTPEASVSRATGSWIELSKEFVEEIMNFDDKYRRQMAKHRCPQCKLLSTIPEDFLSAWKTTEQVDSAVKSDGHERPSDPTSRTVSSQPAEVSPVPVLAATPSLQGHGNVREGHRGTVEREGEGVLCDATEVEGAMCASNELQLAKGDNGPRHVHYHTHAKDCTFNIGSPTPVPPCHVKTEAPVEALGPMSGMAELSSRIQSNVMAEHMDGGCFGDISATGLSAAQIASVSQSYKIQRFSKEIILKLPSGSGGSFYSSRDVERMLEGVTHTHASCLEIAFTEWSRNEQVPNRVELLQQLIEDDNNWELDMKDARCELERILSCRQT